ncbi:MAG: prolyl oligopeptidase family serine peptidase [Candidatus Sumerlaeaceae bacterium]|nr:prolyl oligopeptidase family serine peptidase [Candidatus Sumerlaeaceae bacterium]
MKPCFTHTLFVALAIVSISSGNAATRRSRLADSQETTGQKAATFNRLVTKTFSGNYLVHIPKLPKGERKAKYPLILFLHGSGERGTDLSLVKKHGPPSFLDEQTTFPFIVVSPQCPLKQWWDEPTLMALLDDVEKKYPVDLDRVYLTGISMGGFATWELATKHPERFAAIIPICGAGNPYLAENLKTVPIWAFHGAKDQAVPVSATEVMVPAVKKAGGDAQQTIYPDATHNSWTRTYANPEIYEWLLQHTKKPGPPLSIED